MRGSCKYHYGIGKLHVLLVMILIFYPLHFTFAQDESTIRPFIGESELKKLDKANDYLKEADKKSAEAGALNVEVYTVQSNQNLKKKAVEKKVARLEQQARQKQFEALGLKNKCNELKFAVFKQNMDEFWKTHDGQESVYLNAKILEEQASDQYYQAINYRVEAKKMKDPFARFEKLTQADDLESQAIQKQLSALTTYHGITEIQASVEDDSLGALVHEYADTDTFSVDSVFTDTIVSSSIPEEFTNANSEPDTVNSRINETTNEIPAEAPVAQVAIKPDEDSLHTGLIFKIQVAASKVPLSAGQIQQIYSGSYPIEMIREDSWYKYQMMGVRLYTDAIQIIKDIRTNGVFISAYTTNGDKIPLAEAVRKNRVLEKQVRENGRKEIDIPEYHVQLAASKSAIPPAELSFIYSGPEPVSVIFENGWYKYHIKAGHSFQYAKDLLGACGVSNAFIVEYNRAVRVTNR